MFGDLFLGSNLFRDCETAIIVNGEEVFRLRERYHDGQFIVDFDMRDAAGNRIAKVAKNHVVYCAPGFEPRSQPGLYQIVETSSGMPIGEVTERSPVAVQVAGRFCIDGWTLNITTQAFTFGYGGDESNVMSHNMFMGMRSPVAFGQVQKSES